MKITISLFGKPKSKALLELVTDYNRMICRFQKTEIQYFPSMPDSRSGSALGLVISKYKNAKIYILDEDGQEYNSKEFADLYQKELNNGTKEIVFCIGPSEGFGNVSNLKSNNIEIISLSKMTLQHDLAYLFLTEQLYRAVSIKNNLPYHKI
jgi:23S rRNA (pseudouridine1915-N3)-methyltransferase